MKDLSMTNKRIPLSKKTRFEVFKRDLFKCQYCGASPPSVVLEVDHIKPVSKGGGNNQGNLLTGCFDCNRGKGAGLLTSIPESVNERAAIIQEKLLQVKAFERLIKAKRKHEEKSINEVEQAFKTYFDGYCFLPRFRESVRTFLKYLPAHDLVEYMQTACVRVDEKEAALRYFCGICWSRIKEQRHGQS